MKLSELPKTTQKSKKRIGRGHGSGRGGHTSTRGKYGQKSKGKVGLFFEGTKIKKSLLKRLPLFRGKGKFKSFKPSPLVVNLKFLNLFKEKEEVNVESLKSKGILAKNIPSDVKVKILGEGEISVPLTVSLPTSKGAREKIEKAGGKVLAEGEKKEVARLDFTETSVEARRGSEKVEVETAEKTKRKVVKKSNKKTVKKNQVEG